MHYRLVVSADSATGRVRSLNEDSFLATDPLFFVADGMGGHAFGDRASQQAIATLADLVPAGSVPTPEELLTAVASANTAVRALSGVDDTGPMVAGTTLSGIARVRSGDGEHWMVVNIGDSRVYSWDGRTLLQLTVDHSAVQELLDAGQITADEAAVHAERNVITRALGAEDRVEADVWILPLSGMGAFLVCSDGLTKELAPEGIAAILAGDGESGPGHPPADVAQRLVAAADAAGGHDNITAIVVESRPEETSSDTDDTRERPGMSGVLEETRPRG